jgi:hypothetical protein
MSGAFLETLALFSERLRVALNSFVGFVNNDIALLSQ